MQLKISKKYQKSSKEGLLIKNYYINVKIRIKVLKKNTIFKSMIRKTAKITNYLSTMNKKNLNVVMVPVQKNWEKITVVEEVQELVVWDTDSQNLKL